MRAWIVLVSGMAAAAMVGACDSAEEAPSGAPQSTSTPGPEKPPPDPAGAPASSDVDRAKASFWDAFTNARYERIAEVDAALRGARASAPSDPDLTRLLGLLHLWELAEWERAPRSASEMPGVATQAHEFLSEAHAKAPDDYRIHGWLGGTKLAIARLTQDAKLRDDGLALLQEGVSKHPEFNLFVQSLVLSGFPASAPEFAGAVDAMWKNADVCAGEAIDRTTLDYSKYMPSAVSSGAKRVCWSVEKAPHNFEGFFLHMGDVLVKSGKPDVAVKAYANAKLSPSYGTWGYKSELEQRIANASTRAALYSDVDPKNDPPLVMESKEQCMACHAR